LWIRDWRSYLLRVILNSFRNARCLARDIKIADGEL
jgi:hypothetical protein